MSQRAPLAPSGICVVDKPTGITSHDVVARLRRILGTRKVGHAGTLDPMATGVLVLGVGQGTRLLTYLVGVDKEYRATIRLGSATSTDDAEGETIARSSIEDLDSASVQEAMSSLTGSIDQVPPAVSAIKVAGQRSYARVRAGEQVELRARRVHIDQFTMLRMECTDDGHLDLDVDVHCSSGTYIRALARDLGRLLGTHGHITALRRTRVGPFTIEQATPLSEDLQATGLTMVALGSAARLLLPTAVVPSADVQALRHGRAVTTPDASAGHEPVAVLDETGDLVAICERRDAVLHPMTVFAGS